MSRQRSESPPRGWEWNGHVLTNSETGETGGRIECVDGKWFAWLECAGVSYHYDITNRYNAYRYNWHPEVLEREARQFVNWARGRLESFSPKRRSRRKGRVVYAHPNGKRMAVPDWRPDGYRWRFDWTQQDGAWALRLIDEQEESVERVLMQSVAVSVNFRDKKGVQCVVAWPFFHERGEAVFYGESVAHTLHGDAEAAWSGMEYRGKTTGHAYAKLENVPGRERQWRCMRQSVPMVLKVGSQRWADCDQWCRENFDAGELQAKFSKGCIQASVN